MTTNFNGEVPNLGLCSDLRAYSAEPTHTGTCKNGADGGFPCPVVSQENGDLPLVQVHTQILDGYAFTPSPVKDLWESQGAAGRVTHTGIAEEHGKLRIQITSSNLVFTTNELLTPAILQS